MDEFQVILMTEALANNISIKDEQLDAYCKYFIKHNLYTNTSVISLSTTITMKRLFHTVATNTTNRSLSMRLFMRLMESRKW